MVDGHIGIDMDRHISRTSEVGNAQCDNAVQVGANFFEVCGLPKACALKISTRLTAILRQVLLSTHWTGEKIIQVPTDVHFQ